MKKILLGILLAALFAGAAFAAEHKIGVLSKLNMTRDEFQAHIEAERQSGGWSLFTQESADPVSFVFYDSFAAMQLALNAGEVDELSLPEDVGEYMVNTNPGYSVACIVRIRPVYLAFGFRKSDDPALKDKFNDALMSMKADGTLSILESKYVAEPGIGEPEPVKFEHYNGMDTIKVAVTGDLPPIDLVAADGKPAGFNTAVLAEIGRRLHLNIELLNVESGARAAALASGRADVVFWMQAYKDGTVQPDVPEAVVLSEPYYSWNKDLHIRKD